MKDLNELKITLSLQQKVELAGKRRLRTEVADYGYKITLEESVAQALSLLSETEYAFYTYGLWLKNVLPLQIVVYN